MYQKILQEKTIIEALDPKRFLRSNSNNDKNVRKQNLNIWQK